MLTKQANQRQRRERWHCMSDRADTSEERAIRTEKRRGIVLRRRRRGGDGGMVCESKHRGEIWIWTVSREDFACSRDITP